MTKTVAAAAALVALAGSANACRNSRHATAAHPSPTPPLAASTSYPPAVDPSRVGSYPTFTKSGAGYFYDEVLEYRVWVHHVEGGDDTFKAFATYEQALRYSEATAGAEVPLALVRQRESINEPSPGVFVHERVERLTEWRVEWLAGNQRQPGSIERCLEERRGGPTRR